MSLYKDIKPSGSLRAAVLCTQFARRQQSRQAGFLQAEGDGGGKTKAKSDGTVWKGELGVFWIDANDFDETFITKKVIKSLLFVVKMVY